MIKTWADLDPNEVVTKTYLNKSFIHFENKIDKKLSEQFEEFKIYNSKQLKEQLEEFKRYNGSLLEEFQGRVSGLGEMVMENRGEIVKHRMILRDNGLY